MAKKFFSRYLSVGDLILVHEDDEYLDFNARNEELDSQALIISIVPHNHKEKLCIDELTVQPKFSLKSRWYTITLFSKIIHVLGCDDSDVWTIVNR